MPPLAKRAQPTLIPVRVEAWPNRTSPWPAQRGRLARTKDSGNKAVADSAEMVAKEMAAGK